MNPRNISHGSYSEYTNHGCRCDECRSAARLYHKKQREERGAEIDARNTALRVERREWLNQYKTDRGCVDCGYYAYPVALDFDHLPEYEKLNRISILKYSSMEKLMAEIAKCEIVCANCHRVRTEVRSGRH